MRFKAFIFLLITLILSSNWVSADFDLNETQLPPDQIRVDDVFTYSITINKTGTNNEQLIYKLILDDLSKETGSDSRNYDENFSEVTQIDLSWHFEMDGCEKGSFTLDFNPGSDLNDITHEITSFGCIDTNQTARRIANADTSQVEIDKIAIERTAFEAAVSDYAKYFIPYTERTQNSITEAERLLARAIQDRKDGFYAASEGLSNGSRISYQVALGQLPNINVLDVESKIHININNHLTSNREITVLEIDDLFSPEDVFQTTVVLKITNTSLEPQNNVTVIETIPKEIVQSVEQLTFKTQPEILESDPVVKWTFASIAAGETKELTYSVKIAVTEDQYSLFSNPDVEGRVQASCLTMVCDDGKSCTQDTCANLQCVYTEFPDGSVCDTDGVCIAGICVSVGSNGDDQDDDNTSTTSTTDTNVSNGGVLSDDSSDGGGFSQLFFPIGMVVLLVIILAVVFSLKGGSSTSGMGFGKPTFIDGLKEKFGKPEAPQPVQPVTGDTSIPDLSQMLKDAQQPTVPSQPLEQNQINPLQEPAVPNDAFKIELGQKKPLLQDTLPPKPDATAQSESTDIPDITSSLIARKKDPEEEEDLK